MEKYFNVVLDTKSEYDISEKSWPKPCCNVMVKSDELVKLSFPLFNREPGDGYLDIYADIDPERRLVTNFKLIFKAENGNQEELDIAVTSPVNQVSYYKDFENEGGKNFTDFIEDSLNRLNSIKMEYIGGIVDIFDDFLEEKDVRIPSSDEAMRDDGYNAEDNAARIYGCDYSLLFERLSQHLRISDNKALKDRSDALMNYYEKSNNELDYYTELAEFASLDMVSEWYGEKDAEHIKDFWENHGIEYNY